MESEVREGFEVMEAMVLVAGVAVRLEVRPTASTEEDSMRKMVPVQNLKRMVSSPATTAACEVALSFVHPGLMPIPAGLMRIMLTV